MKRSRSRFEIICSVCSKTNPPGSNFCNECGNSLYKLPGASRFESQKTNDQRSEVQAANDQEVYRAAGGERKHVTVLFSDLSGYSVMSAKLDPEEVKEITSRIFGDVAQIVSKYKGFIEKFAGDAVMALFGVPKAHEDDPIRAIKAAKEIHELVRKLSPELEDRIGQPLSMHTGINTGLVVTGEVNLEKGTHGVAGETISLAASLSNLSKPDEISVGPDTHRRAEGYFTFQKLASTKVKGRKKPIQTYKVLAAKELPKKSHRLSGRSAELIGRQEEMDQLSKAVQELQGGKGSIFAIYGEAGTGKSRLIEEFKATLNLEEIQWREGHSFAYSQNIPYFPLIDIFNRRFQIEEGESPEKVREKIEAGVRALIGNEEHIVPYIGSLYELSYPEVEAVSPESWKYRLHQAIFEILAALSQRAATVICLEDLHWADNSSLELLHVIFSEFKHPVLFLCAYRPPFNLFSSKQIDSIEVPFREARLQDLTPTEAQNMMESLLNTKSIPLELRQFIQDKAEGNPFYLEEVINTLVESETLVSDNGGWRLTRSISEFGVSPTIYGVISARLDRLEFECKRILQQTSVIGRTFFYEIIRKVTKLEDHLDRCLANLERLDLIKKKSGAPELEYVFKHALTQEVAYGILLKKERRAIHARIGVVIEQLFSERLPEFYETLAYHFTQGQSVLKAVDYLMKSGEKSLKKYAVEEAHQYFKEAFDLLSNKFDKSKEEQGLFVDLINKWALVFYYRGDFGGLEDLLRAFVDTAESLNDKERLGVFYAWYGFALFCREKLKDSYHYLRKALALGEEIQNKKVIGYACTWLTWTCADLGSLEEGIHYADRAQAIAPFLESDAIVFFQSLGGMGHIYFFSGDSQKNFEIGSILLDYGKKHADLRCLVVGHIDIGHGHITSGNLAAAIECYQKAINVSEDPFYSQWPKFFLGWSYVYNGQFKEAEDALEDVVSFCEQYGCENLGTPASIILGAALLGQGRMSQGLKLIKEAHQSFIRNERKCCIAHAEYIMGNIYLQLAEGAWQATLSTIFKNLGFLIRQAPNAGKKAESHFQRGIKLSKEIGAKTILGQAYLDLALLYKAKGKTDQARDCIADAIKFFEQCEAETFLVRAKEALKLLK